MKALFITSLIVSTMAFTLPNPPNVVVSSIGELELDQIVRIKTSKKGKEISLKVKPGADGLIQAGIFDENGERLKLVNLSESQTVDIQEIPEGVYVMRVVDESKNMNMYRIEKKG